MSDIRMLVDNEFREFVDIVGNAYPGSRVNSAEDKQKLEEAYILTQKEEPRINFYGCFRDGKLVGGMRYYDFMMNFRGSEIKAGGVGQVAVDLMHKKEKVARDMVSHFINHYRDEGALFAMLYAFRPDFYRNMGFGLGAKVSQYCVRPADLPAESGKAHVEFFRAAQRQELMEFYHRMYRNIHGMIRREEFELSNIINYAENMLAICKKDGRIQGCMVFSFRKANESNFLLNDIYIREILYENTGALMELLAFLNSQQDQIRHVIINIHDDYLNYIFKDPRNCSGNLHTPVYHECNLQELGVMYRAINIEGILKELKARSFGVQVCKLKLTIEDDFLADNNRSFIVHFTEGHASFEPGKEYEAELKMKIADFSSMIIGAVSLKKLYGYNLAELSDPGYVEILDKIFGCDEKPICVSQF